MSRVWWARHCHRSWRRLGGSRIMLCALISVLTACSSKTPASSRTKKAIPSSWSFAITKESPDEGSFGIDGLHFSAQGTLFCVGRLNGTFQNSTLSFAQTSTWEEGLVVVLEFSLDGALLRATPIGIASRLASFPLAFDSQGNLLVAASLMKALGDDHALFDVAKVEKGSGRILWTKRFDGMVVTAIAADTRSAAGGDFYVGGYFGGVLPIGSKPRAQGEQDMILLRANHEGDVYWSRAFGGAPGEQPPAIAYGGMGFSPGDADSIDDLEILHDGNLAFAARFENDVQIGNARYQSGVPTTLVGVVDKTGTPLWTAKLNATYYGPSSIARFSNGFLVLSSQVTWDKDDSSRLYSLDKKGAIIWQRDLVLEGSRRGGTGMKMGASGESIYVSGSFEQGGRVLGQEVEQDKSIAAEPSPYFRDSYLAELSPQGVALKVQARGAATGHFPIALSVTDGYYAVGYCKQVQPRGQCKARIEFQRTSPSSGGSNGTTAP